MPAPTDSAAIPEAQSKLDVNIAKTSKEDITRTIWKAQNRKAPAEVLKADINTSTPMLYEIFERVWEKETIPANNYRGITMLSAPGQILS